jgi:hypothetical protein
MRTGTGTGEVVMTLSRWTAARSTDSVRWTSPLYRLLATVIFAYAGLAAAQWGSAARYIFTPPPPGMWLCGNAISDPYMLLVNVVAPLAAIANVALLQRSFGTRRWTAYTITASLTFLATSACLAYEGYWLSSDFGLPLGDVWWLPGP